jgi:hypothetical protein
VGEIIEQLFFYAGAIVTLITVVSSVIGVIVLLIPSSMISSLMQKRRSKDQQSWQEWASIPEDALICRIKAIVKKMHTGVFIMVEDWQFKSSSPPQFRTRYYHILQLLSETLWVNDIFVKKGDFLAIKFEILGIKNFIDACQAGREGRKVSCIGKNDILLVYSKELEMRFNREDERREKAFITIREIFGENALLIVKEYLAEERNWQREKGDNESFILQLPKFIRTNSQTGEPLK